MNFHANSIQVMTTTPSTNTTTLSTNGHQDLNKTVDSDPSVVLTSVAEQQTALSQNEQQQQHLSPSSASLFNSPINNGCSPTISSSSFRSIKCYLSDTCSSSSTGSNNVTTMSGPANLYNL